VQGREQSFGLKKASAERLLSWLDKRCPKTLRKMTSISARSTACSSQAQRKDNRRTGRLTSARDPSRTRWVSAGEGSRESEKKEQCAKPSTRKPGIGARGKLRGSLLPSNWENAATLTSGRITTFI